MDYLDPKKKKNKKIRLMIGYGLLGVAIAMVTAIVVSLVNGYYIDTETGNVIQNGLVYVDSRPESAKIFLNGEEQGNRTDARMVVPEGTHTVQLDRDGYRAWERSFFLEGGSLRRLTYSRLMPRNLQSEDALTLPTQPTMTSQSPDKRWMIMAFSDNPLLLRVTDLNSTAFKLTEVPLPLEILTTKEAGKWKVLDWADNNKTFLAEYRTAKTVEYVLVDHTKPEEAKNVRSVFPDHSFSSVTMRNRKHDLVWLHTGSTGALSQANVSNGEIIPFLNDVIDYTAFGNNDVLHVSEVGAKEGFAKVVLKAGDKEYLLREIKKHTSYLLDMSKIGNALVMGAGSETEGRVFVYNDPIKILKDMEFSDIPVPTAILKVTDPKDLSISSDSSVIMARGSKTLASHEFEDEYTYSIKLDKPYESGQELRWMDGQHLTYSSDGVQQVVDFDGSNPYDLVSSIKQLGSYFDKDIDHMYTFSPPDEKSGKSSQLVRTFMRTQADR